VQSLLKRFCLFTFEFGLDEGESNRDDSDEIELVFLAKFNRALKLGASLLFIEFEQLVKSFLDVAIDDF
jgi:hypothetical protein